MIRDRGEFTKYWKAHFRVVRYTSGATFEGELTKKSDVYQEIMSNMSLYTTTVG